MKLGISFLVIALVVSVVCATSIQALRTTDDLRAGNESYSLTVVTTQADQKRGLGGKASLPTHDGMLFVFTKPAVQCMWMRNMRFALDMIWLNSQKQVVAVRQNISPATYPHTFCPSEAAKYVIELNAGQVQAVGIHVGQRLSF